jgi:hypothetical protein
MPSNLHRVLMVIALMCPGSAVLADVITDWDQKGIDIVVPRMPSTHSQRIVAIMHAAMFDAVNSIERRYQPYIAQLLRLQQLRKMLPQLQRRQQCWQDFFRAQRTN